MALFSVTEAREFSIAGETPLSDTTDYPQATIEAAAVRIKERFEDICGVAFEPTENTVTLDGGGRVSVLLPHSLVSDVSAVSVDDSALDVTDVTVYDHGELFYATGWAAGARNVEVTYTHGYATVPASIKWAALVVCVAELSDDKIVSKYVSTSDEAGTTQLAVAGGEGRWYGIPIVDSILRDYVEKRVAIG